MKKFFILLMVILLIMPIVTYAEVGETSTTTQTAGVTELTNGSFETDENEDNCPDGWECSVDGDGTYDILTNPVHKGAQSFMTYDNNTDGYNIIEQAEVAVTPGITYMTSVWHRTNNVSDSPYIQLIFRDANGDQIQEEILYADANLNPTHDWKEISGKVTAPSGAATVDFRLAQDGVSGSIYWDSASIKDVGNVMFNGGFENNTDQWTSNGVGSVTTDDSDSAEGVRSIKLSASTDEEVVVEQNGAVNGGVWYRFQGSAKTDNGDAVLKVQWMDASDNIIDEESVIASSSEWDEIAKDIQSPFEAVKVNVQVTHQGTGSTWWDMVNVEQLPEIEDFGSQAFTLHTNNAAFDGHYAYTVTTLGYNFGKIDLNDGSLDALLQANSNSLGTMMHSNGKVYLTSNGVQVYDPDTEKISNLNLPTDCRRLNSLFELSDGKLWGTCYNPSNLFTYDPVTEEFKILDEIDEGRSYLWDVIEYKDKIFLSLGSPGALYVYDPETGVKERILQDLEESKHIRSIKLYGDRLFVKRVNPTDAIVIDADTYEQVEHLENVNGDLAEPDAQNRVLFTYNGDLNYFDLDDDSVGIVDSPHYFPNSGVIGKVRLDDQVNYPGESYAGIQNGGSIFVWNPETDAYKTIEIPMPSAASKTYQLTVGGDGSVYGVGVQGAGSFRVNPDDPLNTEAFDGPGQAEGMAAVGDYIYFGNYPSAVFYRQHVNEPWDPETIFDLGETKQNRPVAMKSYNGKIYIGAIADRGHLAGSFAIYDPATEEVKEYNGLSPDQSITSLAIKGDYAYLGTTIHGGLSSSPVTDEGKLVVFNMDTEQVEETIVPLEGNEVVSALTIGPDGNVWGIGGGDLFVYDTNTKEVTTQTLYDDVGQSHSWGVYGSMLLAQDGNVYGSAGNRLFRLDADKNLTTLFQSANVRRVVEDHQGRIWFSGGPDQTLMRYNTVATSAEEADTTALSEVISTATSLVEGAVVGDEVGQYPQAAVDALETVIAEAEAVLEDDNANQSTVDAAVSTVNTAIDAFNASVILEYPVILPDITIEGVEDGQNYQDPVTPVVSAQVGDIDISKFTAESDTIYVKFEDSTVEDGFGAQLGNLKVFKDNEAIIEFDVGSTTEAEYMFEDDSGDLNGKGRRFVNKDSYWSYKLTGVSDAQSLLLDVNNEYKISIATDEAGPYEIVAYNESNRFDSGINSLEVWVDGEPWTEGTAIEGDGPHTLVAKATSNAGHTATKTIDFTIGEVVEPSVNYLTNPSFEVGEDGVCPEGWGCTSYGSGGVISRDSTVIKDGEWSLKMEDTDTSSGQLVNQTLSLEGGKQYTISGWYKTEAIESKGYVYVFYFDENGNQITNEQLYIDKLGTNDWEAFTLQTSVAPKGTTSIKFNFSMWATPGTIWWDQLSITDAGLSQSIDHANEVLSTADIGDAVGQYPQAAADVLETAITAAEAAVGSEQATVDQAIVTLKKAVEAFYASINEVQRTALEQALTDADAVVAEAEIGDDPGQYPLSAVLAIQSAIEDAEAVLTDDSIENTIEGQETIDQAATILNQALATFEAAAIAGDVDTTALSSAITEANDKVSSAVVGEEVDEYPQTAVDALEAAIAAAESVLADNEADQDQVDAAVTTLNEAVTTFEAAVIKEEDDPSIPDPNAEILVTVKAEDFSAEKSVENMSVFEYTGAATEYQGRYHLGGTRDGRWTAYEGIDFTGATDIVFTQATNKTGGAVDLRLDSKDGQLIGSYEITESAGTFDVVENVNVPISTVEGTHDLYLVYRATHTTAATHIIEFELVAPGTGEDSVDTTALSSAISEANSKLSEAEVGEEVGEYPQTAADALETAIAAAEAVLADDEADQAEVDGAVTTLNQAVITFEAAVVTEAPVDTAALSSAISEANSKVSEAEVGEEVGEYPQAAADALETAIAAAEAVLADDEADQAEVDGAVTALNEAVVTFEAAVVTEAPVETTVLSSALSEANSKLSEAEVGEEVGEYPQTAADALETAIADAEAVLQDEDADQTEVDGAVTTLNQAVESFEAAVNQETPESPLTGVNVDQDDVLLEVDETVELTVKATYEDETSSDVTEAASYSSSDEDVVKVTSAGEVKAVGVGSAQITITYKGETTTVAVKVYSTSIKIGEAVEVVPGEVFTINGSSASIKLPEDLPAGTTVTVVEATDVEHAGYEVAGDVYTVEFTYPDGTTVNGSFTLTLGYDADKYDADDVSIFYYNEETGEWEHQGGVAADGVITLDVPHFSTYGVFAEVDDDDDASDDADDELPDTATSTYNWMLAGIIFLVLGLAFIIVRKKTSILARFQKYSK